MVTIITDEKKIAQLHKQFHNRLNKFLTLKVHCWVGYPSGSIEDTVRYSPELNIWLSHAADKNKFWNGFGVGRPIAEKNNSLNGEINFPYKKINRRIAGVFAEDLNGNILVLHRGKIGGGRPGIGKTYFKDNFRGDFVLANDGAVENEFCLVGELDSEYFPLQVSNFIQEIYRVKQIEYGVDLNSFSELNNFNFTDEHSGRTERERQGVLAIERTHGIVVNALAKELIDLGYLIGNDRNRDLFIHERNQINTLFEIKTSCTTQNLYAAVGQLIIYSIPIKSTVSLIIVLPKKLDKTVAKRLTQHGIKPLYYSWINNIPSFVGLNDLLK